MRLLLRRSSREPAGRTLIALQYSTMLASCKRLLSGKPGPRLVMREAFGVRRIPPLSTARGYRALSRRAGLRAVRLPLGLLWIGLAAVSVAGAQPRFEIDAVPGLAGPAQPGRLFVILARTNNTEPRFLVTRARQDAPITLTRDVDELADTNVLDDAAFTFPITNLAALAAGDYYAQALFECNRDLRFPNAPGNLYSDVEKVRLDPAASSTVHLTLAHALPPEQLPPDSDQVKFIKLESPLLSRFHHRPIYLRAGVILPRDYGRDPGRRYPLWVRVGGLNTRYTVVSRLMNEAGGFRSTWEADDTPRFVLLQLDGAGPFGDPYYVNSANNGPYGDALVHELIPYIERQFHCRGDGRSRVVSGVSTGGWVTLALQIFYPDFFNGAWASCPDPVDFRALELIDLYRETNAYVDAEGRERPSERNLKGEVVLTMRREVGVENLLGTGNSFTCSGEQWGAWNAVYSPRGADGLPAPIWDPHTGKINHAIAEHWKEYDLSLYLKAHWLNLAPKLSGKLHIASGEADQYYLNRAVHLLDEFFASANPPFDGSITFGPGKGHGWSNLSLKGMLAEMNARVEEQPR